MEGYIKSTEGKTIPLIKVLSFVKLFFKTKAEEEGTVAHLCNLSAQETEADGSLQV